MSEAGTPRQGESDLCLVPMPGKTPTPPERWLEYDLNAIPKGINHTFFPSDQNLIFKKKRKRWETHQRDQPFTYIIIAILRHTDFIFFLRRDHFFIKVIYFLFVPGHRTSQGCLLFFTLTIQAIIQDGESAFSKAAPEVKKTPEKHWCHNLPSPSVRDWKVKIPQMSFQQALGWHCSPPKLTSVSRHLSPF